MRHEDTRTLKHIGLAIAVLMALTVLLIVMANVAV